MFSVHQKDSLNTKLSSDNYALQYIPAGCTGLMQPLDTCINKPIKDLVRKSYSDWFQSDGSKASNATPKGYLKPPKPEIIIEWVLRGIHDIPSHLVKKSFKYCGFNNDIYGQESNLINPSIREKSLVEDHIKSVIIESYFNPYEEHQELALKLRSIEELTYAMDEEGLEDYDQRIEEKLSPEIEDDVFEDDFEDPVINNPQEQPLKQISLLKRNLTDFEATHSENSSSTSQITNRKKG
jgi:hypothetical protein